LTGKTNGYTYGQPLNHSTTTTLVATIIRVCLKIQENTFLIPWFITIFIIKNSQTYQGLAAHGRSPSYPEHMSLRGGSDDVRFPEIWMG
jgi:hypothetical protein